MTLYYDNSLKMQNIVIDDSITISNLSNVKYKEEFDVPNGYELIEVVGSKMLKVNGEWQELGYYMTFRRIDEQVV